MKDKLLVGVAALSSLLLTAPESLAQRTLQGRVQNGADLSPLPFASVFLAHTTKGTVAGEDGTFVLNDVPNGRFELIVSRVGFETLKLSVLTTDSKTYRLLLKPAENLLPTVTVRAKWNAKWQENLAFFLAHFIGTSQHADQCQVINPDVLTFSDTPSRFEARASDLIRIENQALGYRIKYALLDFSYDYQAQLLFFKGYPVYEPLTPKDHHQAQRWRTNRAKAYQGSLLHFMRSLYQCRLEEEGFVVQPLVAKVDKTGKTRSITRGYQRILFYPTLADSIIWEPQDTILDCHRLRGATLSPTNQVVVSFAGSLQVTYSKGREPTAYQHMLYPTEKNYGKALQRSVIKLVQPSLTVEADGHFYAPDGLVVQGYWGWELIAEMLPLDYDLAN